MLARSTYVHAYVHACLSAQEDALTPSARAVASAVRYNASASPVAWLMASSRVASEARITWGVDTETHPYLCELQVHGAYMHPVRRYNHITSYLMVVLWPRLQETFKK